MPLYRVRVIGLFTGSGVTNDFMSMSWGVEAAAPPDPDALQAAWVAARSIPAASTSWAVLLTSAWGTYAWEVRAAAGGPVLAHEEVGRSQGNQNPAPSHVTIPVSSLVAAGPRTRLSGRLAIGPLGTGAMAARPNTAYRNYALTFCATWHAQLLGLGCTPVALTQGGTVGTPIVGYSVGDSFGTMKSRSSEVTARTTLLL